MTDVFLIIHRPLQKLKQKLKQCSLETSILTKFLCISDKLKQKQGQYFLQRLTISSKKNAKTGKLVSKGSAYRHKLAQK